MARRAICTTQPPAVPGGAFDFGITVLLWTYFLAGFVFLPPFYHRSASLPGLRGADHPAVQQPILPRLLRARAGADARAPLAGRPGGQGHPFVGPGLQPRVLPGLDPDDRAVRPPHHAGQEPAVRHPGVRHHAALVRLHPGRGGRAARRADGSNGSNARGTFWPEEGTCSFSPRAPAVATGRSGASTRGPSRSRATAGRRSGSSPSATPIGCSGRIRLRSTPAGPTRSGCELVGAIDPGAVADAPSPG